MFGPSTLGKRSYGSYARPSGGSARSAMIGGAIYGATQLARRGKKMLKNRQARKPKVASLTGVLTGKEKKGRIVEESNNTLSKVNYGTLKCYIPRGVLNGLQPQVKVGNLGNNSTSTVGTQKVADYQYADPATLLAMLPSVNDKMILHAIKAELILVNSSASNSCLTLYDVIARKDCSSAANSTAFNAWATGVDSAGGSATDYNTVGSIPTESVTFREFYKIVQSTRVTLGPGEMHRHQVIYRPNKQLTGLYLANVPYQIAGVSLETLVVHHGMPAHDSTTHTSVTIDVSDLDIVLDVSYEWKELENSVTNWSRSNNLATSFAVGEQFVNEAVGQVQDAAGLHPGTLHS